LFSKGAELRLLRTLGGYHYTYESGREGDMPLAGFSPRKFATVLYGLTGFSEALLARGS